MNAGHSLHDCLWLRAGGGLSGSLCTHSCTTAKGCCLSSMSATKALQPSVIAYGPATAGPLAGRKVISNCVYEGPVGDLPMGACVHMRLSPDALQSEVTLASIAATFSFSAKLTSPAPEAQLPACRLYKEVMVAYAGYMDKAKQ